MENTNNQKLKSDFKADLLIKNPSFLSKDKKFQEGSDEIKNTFNLNTHIKNKVSQLKTSNILSNNSVFDSTNKQIKENSNNQNLNQNNILNQLTQSNEVLQNNNNYSYTNTSTNIGSSSNLNSNLTSNSNFVNKIILNSNSSKLENTKKPIVGDHNNNKEIKSMNNNEFFKDKILSRNNGNNEDYINYPTKNINIVNNYNNITGVTISSLGSFNSLNDLKDLKDIRDLKDLNSLNNINCLTLNNENVIRKRINDNLSNYNDYNNNSTFNDYNSTSKRANNYNIDASKLSQNQNYSKLKDKDCKDSGNLLKHGENFIYYKNKINNSKHIKSLSNIHKNTNDQKRDDVIPIDNQILNNYKQLRKKEINEVDKHNFKSTQIDLVKFNKSNIEIPNQETSSNISYKDLNEKNEIDKIKMNIPVNNNPITMDTKNLIDNINNEIEYVETSGSRNSIRSNKYKYVKNQSVINLKDITFNAPVSKSNNIEDASTKNKSTVIITGKNIVNNNVPNMSINKDSIKVKEDIIQSVNTIKHDNTNNYTTTNNSNKTSMSNITNNIGADVSSSESSILNIIDTKLSKVENISNNNPKSKVISSKVSLFSKISEKLNIKIGDKNKSQLSREKTNSKSIGINLNNNRKQDITTNHINYNNNIQERTRKNDLNLNKLNQSNQSINSSQNLNESVIKIQNNQKNNISDILNISKDEETALNHKKTFSLANYNKMIGSLCDKYNKSSIPNQDPLKNYLNSYKIKIERFLNDKSKLSKNSNNISQNSSFISHNTKNTNLRRNSKNKKYLNNISNSISNISNLSIISNKGNENNVKIQNESQFSIGTNPSIRCDSINETSNINSLVFSKYSSFLNDEAIVFKKNESQMQEESMLMQMIGIENNSDNKSPVLRSKNMNVLRQEIIGNSSKEYINLLKENLKGIHKEIIVLSKHLEKKQVLKNLSNLKNNKEKDNKILNINKFNDKNELNKALDYYKNLYLKEKQMNYENNIKQEVLIKAFKFQRDCTMKNIIELKKENKNLKADKNELIKMNLNLFEKLKFYDERLNDIIYFGKLSEVDQISSNSLHVKQLSKLFKENLLLRNVITNNDDLSINNSNKIVICNEKLDKNYSTNKDNDVDVDSHINLDINMNKFYNEKIKRNLVDDKFTKILNNISSHDRKINKGSVNLNSSDKNSFKFTGSSIYEDLKEFEKSYINDFADDKNMNKENPTRKKLFYKTPKNKKD